MHFLSPRFLIRSIKLDIVLTVHSVSVFTVGAYCFLSYRFPQAVHGWWTSQDHASIQTLQSSESLFSCSTQFPSVDLLNVYFADTTVASLNMIFNVLGTLRWTLQRLCAYDA